MKNLILVILLFIGYNSYAQQTSAGPKLGANFSNLSNAGNSKTLTGLNLGGFFVYSFVENFGVSIDLLYSGEGAKYTDSYTENNVITTSDNTLRLNYIRVPLLANVFFGSWGDRLRPKISFGPNFGFLASVKNKSEVTIIDGASITKTNTETTSKDGFSGFDLSALIGAGLNYRVGERTWLNLDARYSIGATDINEVKIENSDAVKNNVFSVSIGLAFGLSGE